jgi:hypothetical protein
VPSKCVALGTVSQEEQSGEMPPVLHGSAAVENLSDGTTAGITGVFFCETIEQANSEDTSAFDYVFRLALRIESEASSALVDFPQSSPAAVLWRYLISLFRASVMLSPYPTTVAPRGQTSVPLFADVD